MAHVHPCQALALIALIVISISILMTGIAVLRASGGEDDLFEGPHWNHPGETVEAHELLAAKYVRVESHTIRSSGGKLVSGWLWVDFHDRVDILVEDEHGRFLLYRQTNYGLPGPSLAVLSSRLAQHEDPLKAAKDELAKEMGRRSRHWVNMGTYRSDANRGGGFVTCFLARRSEKLDESQRVSTDDLESKELVHLTRRELRRAVLAGKVLEVKWANTMALALLHLEHMDATAAAQQQQHRYGGGASNTNKDGARRRERSDSGGDSGGGGGGSAADKRQQQRRRQQQQQEQQEQPKEVGTLRL
ncbi:hypothetical protein PTSG_13086 [Salpingoeca rosetta]|uniref:Nudix hydrolase domain-containing protein n=1 Tax=Salpingoeca rosetta (strain ATCC 50818 / BSB-021) TaxID=946362 RepID=F2UQ31_SALR5|nr:uncharacterized protein PTSG_13086 [Salpingoeca rosetta]EGD79699.1 hypothetical protein PTSG_13086 [Salpingoeca rosetta]|eukprot:XP_004988649.1 hypothetical protein PTSG_13086 [Salpingoeca rosetta]